MKFQNLANFFFQTWMFQITINNYQIYIQCYIFQSSWSFSIFHRLYTCSIYILIQAQLDYVQISNECYIQKYGFYYREAFGSQGGSYSDLNVNSAVLIKGWSLFEDRRLLEEIQYMDKFRVKLTAEVQNYFTENTCAVPTTSKAQTFYENNKIITPA